MPVHLAEDFGFVDMAEIDIAAIPVGVMVGGFVWKIGVGEFRRRDCIVVGVFNLDIFLGVGGA